MTNNQDPIHFVDRRRHLFLSLFLFLLFSLLIVQFYKIQIIEGARWSKEAEKQHYFYIKEPFMRGTFISNTSVKPDLLEAPQSFIVDVQKYHLFADPESIPKHHKESIGNHLSEILALHENGAKEISLQLSKKSRSRKLAVWLDKETRDLVTEWWIPYAKKHKIPKNSLYFINDYQRSYPFGKLLGQVLSTIQATKDEATSQAIPTGGLELYFDDLLKGKQGKRRLMRSPRNSFETGEVISPPEHGANIYLTINHCLQAIAEEEIEKGVKKAKGKSGWAVMMNPYTGEILALAQYPFFYPPDYQSFFNDAHLIEQTKVKAITDAYEPGSIMKPITLAIALKANEEMVRKQAPVLFDPKKIVPTSNPYFPGRKKPLKDTRLHHYLNMHMALQKSSNIYMAQLVEKIVQKLGNEWYRDCLCNDFGFGSRTGIELPSESPGLVPTPGKKHKNGTLQWSGSTPYSLAIGHNIQSSSVQIARAFAIFANGGFLVEPTLIRKVTQMSSDGKEKILLDNTAEERVKRFPRTLPKNIADEVLKAMKYTTKPGGSARKADIWGYTEAGKTGTADKAINGVYCPKYVCSSFVGIAPVKEAAFVLVISIDEPEYGFEPGIGKLHHGGTCAAPIFKEIATRSLAYLGIAPDDPYGYPVGDPRYDPQKADWIEEIRQLQEMYEKWNNNASNL